MKTTRRTDPAQGDLFSASPDNDLNEKIRAQLYKLIEKTDDFRIIERIAITREGTEFPVYFEEPEGNEKTLVFLDTETTGLTQATDKIIELGLVKVLYSPTKKKIIGVTETFSMLEDPGYPIPKEVTEICRITDDMVKGKRIKDADVAAFLSGDILVVAHNAPFDRPFFEKRFPTMDNLSWACSLNDITWDRYGFSGRSLGVLLMKLGYFFDGHRASVDCLALAWLLHLVPDAFAELLEKAQVKMYEIRTWGAPYDKKDVLKARGYRWREYGADRSEKCWTGTVSQEALAEEYAFLDKVYAPYKSRAEVREITAKNRFKS